MPKSLFHVLGATAVLAAALLTPAAASAATNARAITGPPVNTTVTFAVTTGDLTITAPGSADLGTGLPGTTVSGKVGAVKVTDNRALLAATWTATASSTDFATGSGPTLSTIPVADADYDPNEVVPTGTITVTPSTITLSGAAQPVVAATGTGNNTAAWNPVISVDLPPAAVGGAYTSTLTQSVA